MFGGIMGAAPSAAGTDDRPASARGIFDII